MRTHHAVSPASAANPPRNITCLPQMHFEETPQEEANVSICKSRHAVIYRKKKISFKKQDLKCKMSPSGIQVFFRTLFCKSPSGIPIMHRLKIHIFYPAESVIEILLTATSAAPSEDMRTLPQGLHGECAVLIFHRPHAITLLSCKINSLPSSYPKAAVLCVEIDEIWWVYFHSSTEKV